MTECEFCKCEMIEGGEMFDIVKEKKRPILVCPKCKKWEWC